jgi:hypothetical protein
MCHGAGICRALSPAAHYYQIQGRAAEIARVLAPGGPRRLAGAHRLRSAAADGYAPRGRQAGRTMSGTTQRARVIIIGGGQAGMAAGYYLSQAGIRFLILDGGPRGGHAWAQRWDTLELFTPARVRPPGGLRVYARRGRDWPGARSGDGIWMTLTSHCRRRGAVLARQPAGRARRALSVGGSGLTAR